MKENFGSFIKNKYLFLGVSLFIFFTLVVLPNKAFAATYYFNNAVNQSPTEQGNYWDDAGFSIQSSSLPDFGVDEVFVTSGAIFDNDGLDDIVFNGSATNTGTVTGNAIFNDTSSNEDIIDGDATFNDSSFNDGEINGDATFNDSSGNESKVYGNALFNGDLSDTVTGGITGTKTRRYSSNSTTILDFTTDGSWTVIADNVEVDVSDAVYDGTTTFSVVGSGSFVYASVFVYAYNDILSVHYNRNLDDSSVPLASDYTVTVNGYPVSILNVDVSDSDVNLTLASSVVPNDLVLLSYVSGSNPVRVSVDRNVNNFSNLYAQFKIPVGGQPFSLTVSNNKIYVVNSFSNNVSVIDLITGLVLTTIPVELSPKFSVSIGNKVYVSNQSSDTVSVIDTVTDTVVDTINTGTDPFRLVIVGNKLYVANNTDSTISVVNTNTDNVISTISVGINPDSFTMLGNKLYVSNQSSDTVSVIDTVTDTVIETIVVGDGPSNIISYGNKVYVSNGLGGTISVIDSISDTVTDTINTYGSGWSFSIVGNKLYLVTISDHFFIINLDTDSVIADLALGLQPYYSVSFKDKVYVSLNGGTTVAVIGQDDDVIDVINTPLGPYYFTIFGDKIYVGNYSDSSVSAINPFTIPSQLPNLVSFTSTTSSGTYTTGQSINITANFGRLLQAGSTMTVTLNTGDSVTLNNVSGTTLTGTYVVGSGDTTPDLAVTAITSANVTDSTNTYNRTTYDIPTSQGSFTAENSFITRNIGDSKNIKIGSYESITTGSNPYQISVPINGYLYVANQGAGTVSVIRISDNTLTDTITVGDEPYGLTYSNSQLYVANIGSDTVSVIDPSDNTVTDTINVGVKPYYVEKIGNTVYVTNGASNTVSVINTTSNTVTDTIPVGSYPRGIKAHGTDLYVANYGDPNYSGGNYISVIDSLTNEVTDTIILPGGSDGPRGVTVLGSKVYVTNFRSNNVSVINTATNTITNTISVGTGPRGIIGLGTNIYVENFDDGTISVIDTNSNTVTDTITVGSSPAGMSISGTDIYVSSFQDSKLYVLDTTDGTLHEEIPSDTTNPTISSISSTPSTNSVTITWTTDEASSSIINYGLTSSYGTVTTESDTSPRATSHSVIVTSLSCSTLYHFKVSSTDASSNTGESSDTTFTTSACSSSSNSVGSRYVPLVKVVNPVTVVTENTNLTKTLKLKMIDAEVKKLQVFLNTNGFILTKTGAGSPGNETTKYGLLTLNAVKKFQKKYGLKVDGIVGKNTREVVNGVR